MTIMQWIHDYIIAIGAGVVTLITVLVKTVFNFHKEIELLKQGRKEDREALADARDSIKRVENLLIELIGKK